VYCGTDCVCPGIQLLWYYWRRQHQPDSQATSTLALHLSRLVWASTPWTRPSSTIHPITRLLRVPHYLGELLRIVPAHAILPSTYTCANPYIHNPRRRHLPHHNTPPHSGCSFYIHSTLPLPPSSWIVLLPGYPARAPLLQSTRVPLRPNCGEATQNSGCAPRLRQSLLPLSQDSTLNSTRPQPGYLYFLFSNDSSQYHRPALPTCYPLSAAFLQAGHGGQQSGAHPRRRVRLQCRRSHKTIRTVVTHKKTQRTRRTSPNTSICFSSSCA
jgi:hypothetical protein